MSNIRKFFAILGVACAILFASSLLLVVIYKWVPVTDTPFMRAMSSKNNCGVEQKWVPLEQISSNVALAVISSEDNLFGKHKGFSLDAMKKAHAENQKKKGKKIRGGSTITQQTAKNVFLWNGRSYLRKGLELGYTLLVELVWGKERIMEVYLNIIEQGPGVYGVEASAQKYFHHSAAKLSRSEAALMAAVLPNPVKLKIAAPTAYVRKRQGQIENLMRKIGKAKYE